MAFTSAEYARQYRAKNRERINKTKREWYARSEQAKKKQAEYHRRWQKEHAEHVAEYQKKRRFNVVPCGIRKKGVIFINKIIICGRLTRDPETRTGNGTQVTRYTVAVDRKFKRDGQPEADFFNCTAFGKGAEFADKYLRQGTKVIVTGRMESDNYTNKDGQKVYAWQLVVEEQEFAESKKASQDRDDTTNAEKFIASQVVPAERYVEISDGIEEDLPFI